MNSTLKESKLRFPIFFAIICTTAVLSMYTWTVTFQFSLPKMPHSCECQSCIKDGDPGIRKIIDASPPPFLSRNYTVPEEAFRWWKSLQGTPQDFDYFMKTVDKLFQIFPPVPDVVIPGPDGCKTCAVVGNSGNLAGSHYGPLIDYNDFVIRLNRGRTKGYEEHVGTKTTHRAMYPESAINLVNTTHLVFFPFKMKDLEWLLNSFAPSDGKSQTRGNRNLVMILNPAFMKYVQEEWLQKKGGYPSSGFMALILSLVICDEVNVFGFGADRDGNWDHYFEKLGNKNLRTGPHAGMFEFNIIEDLHQKKIVQFYKGI